MKYSSNRTLLIVGQTNDNIQTTFDCIEIEMIKGRVHDLQSLKPLDQFK